MVNKMKLRKYKMTYDVASLPEGVTPKGMLQTADVHGLVVYDSTKGNKPTFVLTENTEEELPTLLDANGKEVDLTKFQQETEERLHWEKELYKCKKSPLHYFKNYINYKPTSEQIDKFYKDNNLEVPESYYTAKDEEGRTKAREELAKKYEDFYTNNITQDNLIAKKVLFEKDKEFKDNETKEISDAFLTQTSKEATVDNIVNSISKLGKKNIPNSKYKMYVKKNGQLDKKLLKGTDIFYLVRLWKVMNSNSLK